MPSQEKGEKVQHGQNPGELEMAKQFGNSASLTLLFQNEKEVIGWKNVAPISTLELGEYLCIRITTNCERSLENVSKPSLSGAQALPSSLSSTLGIYACKMPKTLKKTLANLISIEGNQQRKFVAKEEGEELKLAEISLENLANGEIHQVNVEYENDKLTCTISPSNSKGEESKNSVSAIVKLSDFVKLDNGTCFIGLCNESGSVMSNMTIKNWWFSSSNLPYHKDGWNGLSLEFEPTWPLHLILSPEVLEKYNNLFRFLLPFRRIQILLHKEWMSNTRLMTSAKHKLYIRKLMNLRGQMAFFLNNVMSYFQVDVLEAQWNKLEEIISKSQDFEEVRKSHDAYLSNIHAQCLVNMSKLVKALEELLFICMKMCFFLDRVEASEDYTFDMNKDYETIKEEFENQSALIFKMMSNVKKNQSSPFLSQLLLRLDYNKYYSELAAKLDKKRISEIGSVPKEMGKKPSVIAKSEI